MPRKIFQYVSKLFYLIKLILDSLVAPELLELIGGW
jgi:hypothetical protein